MKKFFFLALLAFLWLPATTWASEDEHTGGSHDSGQVDGSDDEVWDGEEEDEYGSIVPSDIQLTYKIKSQPTGTYGDSDYEDGTVELESVYFVPTGITSYSLSIPHEIQVVNIDMTNFTATVALYTVIGIGDNAFTSNTAITALTIPYTVQYVGANAFQNCTNMTSLDITDTSGNPSQLTTIGAYAFNPGMGTGGGTGGQVGGFGSNGLTSIDLPNSLTTIGEYAFEYNSFESLTLPEGLTTIGAYSFANCDGLTDLVIPTSLTTIPTDAFYGCTALLTITMSGATTLENSAFGACTKLQSIVLTGETATGGATGTDPFAGDENDNITVYAPTGYAAAYYASDWNDLVEADSELSWNFFSTNVSANGYDGTNTYYATYYVDEEGYILDGGTAYYVSGIENDAVVAESITGLIPINTAILIGSSAAGDYYFYKVYGSTDTEATITGNMLYGSNVDVPTVGPEENVEYYFYKLSRNKDGDPGSVGFYWNDSEGGAFTNPAYKAYLAVPQAEATSLNYISFKKSEDDTTGISAIESASEKTVSGIYTIQGVRVSNMNQPGLYIVDGKKVLVK